MNAGKGTTHFGFKTVAEDEKSNLVRAVFDSVAPSYDLMNDLMSLGIHRLWKSEFVNMLKPRPGMTLLDVAGGTGDIAFRALDKGAGHVVVCDINREMLSVGRDRAMDRGLVEGLSWVVGDAEKLPIEEASVDAYTIAFGLRNVTHIDQALAEARRVLRPGGRFMCLEFSRVVVPLLDRIYDTYSFSVLPWLGDVVAKDAPAYQYLAESIRRFPPQEELAGMMAEAGLSRPAWRNFTGGIAAVHSGWRL